MKIVLPGTALIFVAVATTYYFYSARPIESHEPIAKSDKLMTPVREILLSKPVKVESIKMAASDPPLPKPPPDPLPPKEQARVEHEQPAETLSRPIEICARSGGRKITRNHGRSWRCIYPR